jgi:hypothetical protein
MNSTITASGKVVCHDQRDSDEFEIKLVSMRENGDRTVGFRISSEDSVITLSLSRSEAKELHWELGEMLFDEDMAEMPIGEQL